MSILVYTAKFLCGLFDPQRITDQGNIEGPVKPGRYATAINVHNPNPVRPVSLRKKAVLLFSGSTPHEQPPEVVHQPGPLHQVAVGPDGAFEIDCSDIRAVLLAPAGPPAPEFIKGMVVIETAPDTPLDVVAVYTAEPIGAAPSSQLTMEIDRVTGSLIQT